MHSQGNHSSQWINVKLTNTVKLCNKILPKRWITTNVKSNFESLKLLDTHIRILLNTVCVNFIYKNQTRSLLQIEEQHVCVNALLLQRSARPLFWCLLFSRTVPTSIHTHVFSMNTLILTCAMTPPSATTFVQDIATSAVRWPWFVVHLYNYYVNFDYGQHRSRRAANLLAHSTNTF